ncbi:MAG TPA: fasciclin domain-containing protein [Anaeromyxobacteraceae bacterium]|nr:fasciclin domain-containing protein [Anaeromyxobacteraceae bacterium]
MKQLAIPLALSLGAVLTACGDSSDTNPAAPTQNVVQLAQGNPDLGILVEAVGAADLAGALSGPGPFTVFAPTNAAFAALLTELGVTKAELLANKPLLTAVLQYHVLGAAVRKDQIPLGKAISPLAGGIFKIDLQAGQAVITDGRNRTARIVATDVPATNGVVHVIDRVILPADKNIVETAQAISDFSILVDAVVAAGLAPTLSGPGPFTVFAPTNAAFAALLGELGVTKDQLLSDTSLLTAVLTYHVIGARVLKADVVPGVQPATVQGETFSISPALAITDRRARTSNIVTTDVITSNGIIHVIDRVILPSP